MSRIPGIYSEKYIEHCIVKEGVRVVCDGAFNGCEKMESVFLPSSLNIIGSNAFNGCIKLNEINIPNSVVYLGFKALSCEGNLSIGRRNKPVRITIPDSVEMIDGNPFGYNTIIKSDNKRFQVINNVLYSADGTKLISYCSQDDNFIVPDGVKVICSGAFDSTPIRQITLPNTLEVIERYAFSWCTELVNIELPESLREIHERAFDMCKFNNRTVKLPSNVKVIDAHAFGLGWEVLCASVPPGRVEHYKAVFPAFFSEQILDGNTIYENGLCLSSDGKELIAVDRTIENIIIPNGVFIVRNHSLDTEFDIDTLQLPASLEQISRDAFDEEVVIHHLFVPKGKKDYYNALFDGLFESIEEC